jgi:hypothetical protein
MRKHTADRTVVLVVWMSGRILLVTVRILCAVLVVLAAKRARGVSI